jgi:hypothetical protein
MLSASRLASWFTAIPKSNRQEIAKTICFSDIGDAAGGGTEPRGPSGHAGDEEPGRKYFARLTGLQSVGYIDWKAGTFYCCPLSRSYEHSVM